MINFIDREHFYKYFAEESITFSKLFKYINSQYILEKIAKMHEQEMVEFKDKMDGYELYCERMTMPVPAKAMHALYKNTDYILSSHKDMDKVIELMNSYIEIGYKETLEMMKDGWKNVA